MVMMNMSDIVIPAVICLTVVFAAAKRADVYSDFAAGAEEGLHTAARILPQLIGLLMAVRAFTASGASDCLVKMLTPVARALKFPPELVPFVLLRPVSGSGSLAMATDIFRTYGTDSFLGRAVSVMMGSTETTFYTVAVYFGAVKVKNVRYTLACALFADLVSAIVSVAVCRVMF